MRGKRIRVTGVVQGVGFRPFVYTAARRLGLSGTVNNDAAGVEILAAGPALDEFIRLLREEPPPLARVEAFTVTDAEVPSGAFIITASGRGGPRRVDLPVDTATCADCWREFRDPHDRRFHYPFINCTNCGPRYTIIRDVPYDRPLTAMAPFPLCPDCAREYADPADRRFHAQPVCCPVCGPRYTDIDRAAALLRAGGIAAVKGIGGFHLACDARNDAVLRTLRQRKDRDEKPFAVMAARPELLDLTAAEQRLMAGIERPILLVPASRAPAVSPLVAPGLDTVGVMLPYTPVHELLFAGSGLEVMVFTSANRRGEPMVIRDPAAALGGIADFILDHDRTIVMRADDSVVREVGGAPVFLRRSRGYAPAPVPAGREVDGILACGAMLKNTIAVGRGTQAYLSPYIGDLESETAYADLEATARHLLRIFDVRLARAACDLHPHYLSTRFAESLGVPVVRVQHHEAHARACMAENRIERGLAVVFDGVGYGTDGAAWGGEIFSIDGAAVRREAHLGYMPMPGGDACVVHPLRLAAAVLAPRGIILPGMEDVLELCARDVNVVRTSGMGRLFDAAAALLGICTRQTYEGQGPMLLEAAAGPAAGAAAGDHGVTRLDPGAILEALYLDRAETAARAARFHNTIITATAAVVAETAARTGHDTVCLTGGCFQNVLLLEGLIRRLEGSLRVCRHRLVPPNDGGIALGQLVAASYARG